MAHSPTPHLKRTLSLPAMVFYGLGTIVGAGIYVLIGKIAGLAGAWAPFVFVLAAFIAGFTGLSYAELVARYPRSAGEAVYVEEAFHRPWLTQIIGWSVVLTGVVSAATLLNGFAGYFIYLFSGSEAFVITATTAIVCLIAVSGVKQSVGIAVAITLLELVGLLLIVFASFNALIDLSAWQSWSAQLQSPPWLSIIAATFLAFYAFIGFEDMVNMAEEVNDVSVVLPKAIILSLIIATLIYGVVACVAVIVESPEVLAKSDAPLATLTEGSTWLSPMLLTIISLIAIINGVIVQVLMVPRVIYGLARSSGYLKWLGSIHPLTRTPVRATCLASVLVLLFALLLPLTELAKLTSTIILCLFILINIALLKIKQHKPFTGFTVPSVIPCLGAIISLVLLLTQLFVVDPG